MSNISDWEFNKSITDEFDYHIKKSLSFYDEIQEIICNLSDFFICENHPIYDLGCSLGETMKRINNRHKDKNLEFIGVDNSSFMIEKAKQVSSNKNTTFINTPIESFLFNSKTNLVLSVLSLQFCKLEDREKIVSRVYNALNVGGAFIFVEKVYANNSQIQDIFTQSLHDNKLKNGFIEKEIMDKDKSLRSKLIPLTSKENLTMLSNVGFQKIDIFYKNLNFSGIIAIK